MGGGVHFWFIFIFNLLKKFIYDFKVLNGSGRRKIGSSSSPPANLGQFLLTVENQMFLHSKDMMT